MLVGLVIGGAVGAPARYLLEGWIGARAGGRFPWGTLTVNVLGSFALGIVTGAVLHHGWGVVQATTLGSGFCGAFTTFSTFTVDTVVLHEEGAPGAAIAHVVVSAGLGLVAAAAGLALMAA